VAAAGEFRSDSEKGDNAATGRGREDEQGQPLKLQRVSEDTKTEFLVATRKAARDEGSKKEWPQQGAFRSDSEKGNYAATGDRPYEDGVLNL